MGKKIFKGIHSGINTNIKNYYLKEKQDLKNVSKKIIKALYNNNRFNYKSFLVGTIQGRVKNKLSVAIPESTIDLKVINITDDREIIKHPNRRISYSSLQTRPIITHFHDGNYTINLFSEWYEIIENRKETQIHQFKPSIKKFKDTIYLKGYAKRTIDGKIGFLYTKIVNDFNANEILKTINQSRF